MTFPPRVGVAWTGSGWCSVADELIDFQVMVGDVNGDGQVTQADLVLMESGGGGMRADLDGDHVVGEDDVAMMNAILSTKE